MLTPHGQRMDRIAFVFGHCGILPDADNRLYAIAAMILEPNGNTRSFDSLIRYSRLTAREHYASGVSAKQLTDAPPPSKVRGRLREFLKKADVVMILDDPDGFEDTAAFCGDFPIIDLGFAAEFFLPSLRSCTLKSLWELIHEKERDKIRFSGPEAAELALDLVRHICGARLNDAVAPHAPAVRHFLRKSGTLFGGVFVHLARRYRNYFGGLFDVCREEDTDHWGRFLERAGQTSRQKNLGGPVRPISPKTIGTLFEGLAEADSDFNLRPEQIQYARHVAEALNTGAVLTLEAGTGTGKTQGYLIPVLEFLRKNPESRAVISTYTKSLQEQIFQREMVFTRSALPHYRKISVALLKGKSSYICAEKLDSLYDDTFTGPELLSWLYGLIMAFHFRTADVDSVGEKVKKYLNTSGFLNRMLGEISARSGCPPKHTRCPAQVVTAEAQAAALVITNHHKLALLDMDPVLGGLFTNYVIDEANHFETAVRNAFRVEVRSREIRDVLDYLMKTAAQILPRAAGDYEKVLMRGMEMIRLLRDGIKEFHEILSNFTPRPSRGGVESIQYDHPRIEDGSLPYQLGLLEEGIRQVIESFTRINQETARRLLKIQGRTAKRIDMSMAQLTEKADALRIISDSLALTNNITIYQVFRRNWSVGAQSVQVGDLIRRQVYERKHAVIYTAATLCHHNRFDRFQDITGMSAPLTIENAIAPKEFRFARIPSPYAADAMEIVIPPGTVSGKWANKKAWIDSVAEALPKLITENNGRTLVLFSSYEDLNVIADRVRDAINATRYPLLIQRPGQPTVNLCDEFRAVKESVLFGVDTFWYGVDFKGDTLTQVIITRIPYPPPSDPLQTARKKVLPEQDFWNRYRYDTDIKMKQGIGRLIRCDTDRGRVVILDSRYRPD
ncbi:MAG: ATP-dependent DNA helicase [Thermodesulfobacteriota bacterium]